MRHDIAEYLEALANELSPLSYIWVEDIKVADILITDVTWTRAHSRTVEKSTDKVGVALFHDKFMSYILCFRKLLSSCRIEPIKCLWWSCAITKYLKLPEAAILKCFIWPPLPFSLGLISYLEVLGGQELMGVLGV
jgi:hypothetical protein